MIRRPPRSTRTDTLLPDTTRCRSADEIPDPHALRVQLWVDRQPRQDFNTSDMGHRIWDSIAYLSGVTALNPGDMIFTGTNTQGLGPLQDGDDFRLEIETVGTLCVRVCDLLNRSWQRGIDTELAARVLEMINNQKTPGAHRQPGRSEEL